MPVPAPRCRAAGLIRRGMAVLLAGVLFGSASSAHAVILYRTSDATANTTPPTGSLTNSGWQYQGFWGSYLGTPVASRYFMTARHFGGLVGDTFWWNGVSYLTTATFAAPDCDLALWRICGTFPAFAPVYTNRDEAGKGLVVFGRGTQRGAPVVTTNEFGAKTNGWLWGPADGAMRWGENTVTQIVDGGVGLGDLVQAEFDAAGGPNECDLSVGDSGGGVFLQEGATWKLAGINYSVDGPYNRTNTGGGFEAALFDQAGLYQFDGTNWVWMQPLPRDRPGSFYATRVSAHVDWINGILSSPLPEAEQLVLQAADAAEGPYRDDLTAAVDEVARTIRVPQPAQPRFYRLRSCQALTVQSVQAQHESLVLIYR
jgi:hypothetical protein